MYTVRYGRSVLGTRRAIEQVGQVQQVAAIASNGMGKGAGMRIGMIADWASRAACRASDPDALFVQGAAQNRAKAVCMGCPVRTECLADALDNRVEFGVWGGMTERERRALLRRRPDIQSWWQVLENARRAYDPFVEELEEKSA